MNPPTKADLESHLARQMESSRGFFWNRVRWDLVAAQLPDGSCDVVDVGAGTGFLGDYLSEHRVGVGYRYVEPLESLEASLEDRFGAGANARDRDFAGASTVTLLDVLEHQEDDRGFLAELAAKMDPGAVLLLTVPAMPWLWSEWDRVLGHYRRYTERSLREAVEGLPLQVLETSYLFPEMIPPAMMRRWRGSAVNAADAEFPELPGWLNASLYRVGSLTTTARRVWPAGSSVFAKFMRIGEHR